MPKKKKIEFTVNDNNCYICTSHAPNGDGYPYTNHEGKLYRTSRLVWILNNGEIPEGQIIRHKCDNRLCINLDHLELGTKAQNNSDRASRGRNRNQNGTKNNMNKLTEEEVKEIKSSSLKTKELVNKYKVSTSNINFIRAGKRWNNINL